MKTPLSALRVALFVWPLVFPVFSQTAAPAPAPAAAAKPGADTKEVAQQKAAKQKAAQQKAAKQKAIQKAAQ